MGYTGERREKDFVKKKGNDGIDIFPYIGDT